MEQVYELTLPNFSDIIRSDFKGFDDTEDTKYRYLFGFDTKDIIKPEWLNFLDFNWTSYRYFKKSNIGSIHTDLADINMIEDYKNNGKPCHWGINWVFKGNGNIKFWEYKNLKYIGNTIGSDNNPKLGVVPKFIPLSKCNYYYDNLENHVYLTNASLPHVAQGFDKRCVFSLRPNPESSYHLSWPEIVEKFKDFIK